MALLIGCDDYKSGETNLTNVPNARRDVEKLSTFLTDYGFEVTEMYNPNSLDIFLYFSELTSLAYR